MLNKQAIIERGYTTSEEYQEMHDSGKLEKINLRDKTGFSEGIWIYPLEDNNKFGTKYHFVFFNDPVMSLGSPRPVAGLVGVGHSHGTESRGAAFYSDCIELFKKAGKPAIDYFWAQNKQATAKPTKKGKAKAKKV